MSEGLVDIFDNVGAMLDANGEADRLGQDAGLALLLGRHLAMSRRRWMTGERFCISDIYQARDQFKRVVEGLTRFESALDPEGKQRGSAPIQIFLEREHSKGFLEIRHN